MPNATAAAGYEHAKTLALADAAFTNRDYSIAANLRNGVTPANIIESNWQSVSNIEAKLLSDTLNSSDVSALQSVAGQCYLTGGNIVWRARAILNSYYGYVADYPNACSANSGNGERTTNIQQLSVINKQLVNLYPNPNNGSMTIEYNIKKDVYLEVTDINGNLVGKYNLPADATKLNIRNDNLNNGVYLYRVLGGDKVIKGKFVIMK